MFPKELFFQRSFRTLCCGSGERYRGIWFSKWQILPWYLLLSKIEERKFGTCFTTAIIFEEITKNLCQNNLECCLLIEIKD